MSGRRRPFKVRGWSYLYDEYVGGSFATRGAAEARGVLYVQAGLGKVAVWENDERGYVRGSISRITEEDAFAATPTPTTEDPHSIAETPEDNR